MSLQTRKITYDFMGAHKPPAVASRLGIWCSKITQTGGACTIQTGSSGAMELTLDATNEVQNLCLYFGDVLPFDIDDLIRVSFLAKWSSGALNAAITGAIGMASARNDTLASITAAALFRFAGGSANSLVLDSRDGTNSQSGIATGEVPGTAWRRLVLDFQSNVKTQSPPSLSLGGKADLGYFISNTNGVLKRAARNTNFSMAAHSTGLQPFVQFQKTAVAAGGTLYIAEVEVEYKLPI